MNAIATPISTLDCRWLLSLYAIVPVIVSLVFVDAWLLDGAMLRQYLPSDPMHWPFWTVIFGLPHIVASLLTMADREYFGHYRKSLSWPLVGFAAIAGLGTFGPQPLASQALFVFLGFYTIYHVLAQQLGLTLMMMGTAPSTLFKAWKWLAIFSGFLIYVTVYASSYFGEGAVGSVDWYMILSWLAAALCAGVVMLSLKLSADSRFPIGKWYLWGNVAMLLSTLIVNEIGYTVFVILIPRVIHDVTAFMIYISHDNNRNKAGPVNIIYRLTHFTRLPPVVLLPVLSMLIAYGMTHFLEYRLVAVVALTVTFLHYYFEGFIWRNPNPHRQHLAFRR